MRLRRSRWADSPKTLCNYVVIEAALLHLLKTELQLYLCLLKSSTFCLFFFFLLDGVLNGNFRFLPSPTLRSNSSLQYRHLGHYTVASLNVLAEF